MEYVVGILFDLDFGFIYGSDQVAVLNMAAWQFLAWKRVTYNILGCFSQTLDSPEFAGT
jgi:hypothetical protein